MYDFSERSVSGTEIGAQRAKNLVSGCGAVSGHAKIRWSGSGARSGRSRSGSGV